MNVAVVNVEANNGDAYFLAGDSFLDSFGNALCEYHQFRQFFVREVEDVVGFLARNYKHMARMNGVDVKKCEMLFVLRNFIRGDFACGDA
jgi:hypothetical protein